MISTTLNRIRVHSPFREGWEKLLAGLGKTKADDEALPFSRIVEINGLDDALWCCRVEPDHAREWGLFAVWCARQVQHLMTDPRSITAIGVAERFANGEATEGELVAAGDAAYAAARDAAEAAAAVAEAVAAGTAAWDAAWAAGTAAWGAARAAQKAKFLEIVG